MDLARQGYSPSDFWGKEVWAEGYVAVPQRLLAHMAQLGLKPADLALLVQLLSHKMTQRDPFPSNEQLAERLGVSISTLQRQRRRLERKLGLIRAKPRQGTSNEYDLSDLAVAVRGLPPAWPAATKGGSQGRPQGAGQNRLAPLVRVDHRMRRTEEEAFEEEQRNNTRRFVPRKDVGTAARERQPRALPGAIERAADVVGRHGVTREAAVFAFEEASRRGLSDDDCLQWACRWAERLARTALKPENPRGAFIGFMRLQKPWHYRFEGHSDVANG